MNILGISAFYHDSAACLVRDGEIIAAAQEERFTRKKHDAEFPIHAIRSCLALGGLAAAKDVDLVAFYEKPFLKSDRLLSTYLACAPRGLASFLKAMPVWIKRKMWIKQIIRDELDYEGEILFSEHHESHAASAFFPSPFDSAAILTIDGVGEWTTTSIGRGAGNRVEMLAEQHFPHSLGLLYSAFTYYLGFRVNSGEYKVMGLAPFTLWSERGVLDELARQIERHPGRMPYAWLGLARHHAARKDFRAAYELTRRYGEAVALPRMSTDSSLEELQERFTSAPDNYAVGYALYRAQIQRGRVDDALSTARHFSERRSSPAYFHLLEAECWAAKENWERAWTAWQAFESAKAK